MGRWIALGRGGSLDADRVVAVAHAHSAPIKRLLAAAGPGQVVSLTYGYPRRSVALLDNGFLVIVSLWPEELTHLLNGGEQNEISD